MADIYITVIATWCGDLWKALSAIGVVDDFTIPGIEKAYKKTMRANHPDLTQDPEEKKVREEKAKDLNGAMDLIRTPESQGTLEDLARLNQKFSSVEQAKAAYEKAYGRAKAPESTRYEQSRAQEEAQKTIDERTKNIATFFYVFLGSYVAFLVLYDVLRRYKVFTKLKLYIDDLKQAGWVPGKQLTTNQRERLEKEIGRLKPEDQEVLLKASKKIKEATFRS